ncbi:hypothetical protein Aduo_015627 [Ancylostoma duodenale]
MISMFTYYRQLFNIIVVTTLQRRSVQYRESSRVLKSDTLDMHKLQMTTHLSLPGGERWEDQISWRTDLSGTSLPLGALLGVPTIEVCRLYQHLGVQLTLTSGHFAFCGEKRTALEARAD